MCDTLQLFQLERIIIGITVCMRAYGLEDVGEKRWLATPWRNIVPGAAILVCLQSQACTLTPNFLPCRFSSNFVGQQTLKVHLTSCHAASNSSPDWFRCNSRHSSEGLMWKSRRSSQQLWLVSSHPSPVSQEPLPRSSSFFWPVSSQTRASGGHMKECLLHGWMSCIFEWSRPHAMVAILR